MNSSLVFLNSTASLSSILIDSLYVYGMTTASFITFCLKLISILVLTKIKKMEKNNDNTINYMLAFEISECFLATIMVFGGLFRCGNLCDLGYHYITKVFQLVFYSFIANVLQQFETFIEIAFAWQRIQAFKVTKKRFQLRFRNQLFVMALVAVLTTLPNSLLARSIEPVDILKNGEIVYQIVFSDFAQTQGWTVFMFVLGLLRSLFLYILILLLNIIAVIKYKMFIQKKNRLINNQITTAPEIIDQKEREETRKKMKKQARITRILVAMSTNFLIGNLPSSLNPLVSIKLGNNSPIYVYYAAAAVFFTGFSHLLYIILYAWFNSTYRKTLAELFFPKQKRPDLRKGL